MAGAVQMWPMVFALTQGARLAFIHVSAGEKNEDTLFSPKLMHAPYSGFDLS